jgi:hypothetical protein
VGLLTIARLIESKTRVRERMFAVMVDLSKLQGVHGQTDWESAINALMDRGLLPTALAVQIRQRVDAFNASVDIEPTPPELVELDPDQFDPIEE